MAKLGSIQKRVSETLAQAVMGDLRPYSNKTVRDTPCDYQPVERMQVQNYGRIYGDTDMSPLGTPGKIKGSKA